MPDILIIKPYDKTLNFLNRIISYINSKLSYLYDIQYVEIACTDESHKNTLEKVIKFNKKGVVLFLGHGRSDYLIGSKHDEGGIMKYSKEEFINKKNIDVFNSKKVIALSCNSADLFEKTGNNKEITAFMGFGDIPTENEILSTQGNPLPNLTSRFKGELVDIIKNALTFSLRENHSFEELNKVFRLLVNKKIADIIINHTGLRERRKLGDTLFTLKNEVRIFGDPEKELIEK